MIDLERSYIVKLTERTLMKNWSWLLIIGVLFFALLSHAKDRLLIFANNFEPYYGESMHDYGPVIKIVQLAFHEAGYDSEVQFHPWARIIKQGKIGECDVIVAVWFSKEREGWMAFSAPILENEIGFYKRKNDNLMFVSYADLKKKNVVIGTVHDYVNPEGFAKAGIKTEEVTEDSQNIRKLLGKRIRLVLVDKQIGAYLLNKEGKEQDAEWLVTLQKKPLYIGIMKNTNKDWKKLTDDFNKGLYILKNKGIVAQVLREYNPRY